MSRFKSLFSKNTITLLLIIITVLAGFGSYAQEDRNAIEVFGQLTSDLGSVKNANIEIKQDEGQWLKVRFSKRTGEFELSLPVGHTFLFRFTQEGTIAKQILFSTSTPEMYENVEFAPFFFMVHLNDYTGTPELDTLFYTDPVGKIFFSEEFIKFDYDREYNLYVKNKVARVKEEVELKQQMLAQKQEAKRLDSIARAQTVALANVEKKTEENTADTVLADNTLVVDTSVQIVAMELPDADQSPDSLTSDADLLATVPDIEEIPEVKDTIVQEETILAANEIETPAQIVTEESEPELPEKVDVSPEREVVAEPSKAESIEVKIPNEAQLITKPDPLPVAMGKKNGNEYKFFEYANSQVTKIYVTRSKKTIIYSMYQYKNGQTRYYKQQPLSNDSIQINRDIFTRSIKQ